MTPHLPSIFLKAVEALINGPNMAGECDPPVRELSLYRSYATENPLAGSEQLSDVVLNKLKLSGNRYRTRCLSAL